MKEYGASQQYAALPWRQAQGFEILLITSRETRRWVIPKGWPMPGHSAAESAAQEAYEEAGVRGQMTAQAIGHYGYSKRLRGGAKKRFRVDVFAMEVDRGSGLVAGSPRTHAAMAFARGGCGPRRMSRSLRHLSGHLPGINWDKRCQPQHGLKQFGGS